MTRSPKPSLQEIVELHPEIWSDKNGRPASYYKNNSSEAVWFSCDKCGAVYKRKAKDVRLHPERCGVCAGKIIISGINDVSSQLPQIISQWDYDLNDKDPAEVGISFKAYFKCHKCLQSNVRMSSSVAKTPNSCIVCSGKKIVVGINDLGSQRPDLVEEWQTANSKTPAEVTVGSGYRALWQCKEKHCWEAEVGARVSLGNGCPFCSGLKAVPGVTDLATLAPSLLKEWAQDLNSNVNPESITPRSNVLYWWRCSNGHIRERTPNSIWDSERKTVRKCAECKIKIDSYGAKELTDFLKAIGEDVKVEVSGILPNTRQKVDIFLPKRNIAIEFNGEYWHSSQMTMTKYGLTSEEFHKKRAAEAKTHSGVLMVFVWAMDWTHSRFMVHQALKELLVTGTTPTLLQKYSNLDTEYKEFPSKVRKALDSEASRRSQ